MPHFTKPMIKKANKTGCITEEDLTKFSDERLEHEYNLAYEVLYDVHCSYPPWNGGVAIQGMLKQDPDRSSCGKEQFMKALSTWKTRLKRAEDEIIDRRLLSE